MIIIQTIIILAAIYLAWRKHMTELERLDEVLASVAEGVTAIATITEELPALLAELTAGDPAAAQARFEKMAAIIDKAKALPVWADVIRSHVADAKGV
jgi:endonuclease IV